MSFDINGNPLRRGYCEVHPSVHEEYPCSLCIAERRSQQQEQNPISCDGGPGCESAHYLGQAQQEIDTLRTRIAELEQQIARGGRVPTDNDLIKFAIEEQFLLFCDQDEFVQIAREVLAKFGAAPPPPAQASDARAVISTLDDLFWLAHPNLTASDYTRFREAIAYVTSVLAAQVPAGGVVLSDAEIDKHLDAILRASGSALKNYSLQLNIDNMRSALRAALAAQQQEVGQ